MTTSSYIYKIHPAIGVARIGPGNQPYDAPTTEGGLPNDATEPGQVAFRDDNQQLNPQAAKFQIYRYDKNNPDDPGALVEIGKDGVTDINWSVWLANKKACWFDFQGPIGEVGGYTADHGVRNSSVEGDDRQNLILDAGTQVVNTENRGPLAFDVSSPYLEDLAPQKIARLGTMVMDESGAMRVIGGPGQSGQSKQLFDMITSPGHDFPYPTGNFANNTGWFDDIADGPVTATLEVGDQTIEVDVPAWVLTGPPKYAPEMINLITLYDNIYDVAVREQNYNPDLFSNEVFNPEYQVNLERDIIPLLSRPDLYQWVASLGPHAINGHKMAAQYAQESTLPQRAQLLEIVRPPKEPNLQTTASGRTAMPYLAGNNPLEASAPHQVFLTLTETQFFYLEQWAKGKVDESAPACLPPGLQLDYGVLQNCVGGPFVPGIEITWISRNPVIYSEPFRIKHKSGITQGSLFYPVANKAYTLKDLFEEGVEPGSLCAFMAQPWQTDFNLCSVQGKAGDKIFDVTLNNTLWWWCAQRPDAVQMPTGAGTEQVTWAQNTPITSGNNNYAFDNLLTMIEQWNELGFVVSQGSGEDIKYLQVDRTFED